MPGLPDTLVPDIGLADVADRTVLVRADLNVPMRGGDITDATRVARFAPAVAALVDRGARVVVMTHLGRPTGECNPVFSTRPVASALSAAVGRDVHFVPDCVGTGAERAVGTLPPKGIALLENLRFHSGETNNSRAFARRLSVLGDIYVNDAFSCSHRAHASTHAIAELMPAFAGPSLLAELAALHSVLDAPRRPVVAMVGGAKVSTKIDVLKNLAAKVDTLVIGGGMANTFLFARGIPIGASLCEKDAVATVREIEEAARRAGCRILLPRDVVVSRQLAASGPNETVPVEAIGADRMALDIGEASRREIEDALGQAATLLWNGPLGAFEVPPYGEGTFSVARCAADLTRRGALHSVVGGGDTLAALKSAGVVDAFTYVSTAGGAFLEWLGGRPLPGIEILRSLPSTAPKEMRHG